MKGEILPGPGAWERVAPLASAVYPPHILATVQTRNVIWSPPAGRIFIRNDQGILVTHVGVHLRRALLDGSEVHIGGIGGVMTHPDWRQKGLASSALGEALKLLRGNKVNFALLFCEEKNVEFYAKLGWRSFLGTVIVEQPNWRGVLPILGTAMVISAASAFPTSGTIDLCGLPW